MEASPIHEMSSHECWEKLRGHELGRLAFHLADEVHITPINYAVDGDRLVFRTAEGNKLLGVVMGGDVAFEIDDHEGESAWSVLVRGSARVLETRDEIEQVENSRLRSWLPTEKHNFVEIRPSQVSGRRFDLDKPWEHFLPH